MVPVHFWPSRPWISQWPSCGAGETPLAASTLFQRPRVVSTSHSLSNKSRARSLEGPRNATSQRSRPPSVLTISQSPLAARSSSRISGIRRSASTARAYWECVCQSYSSLRATFCAVPRPRSRSTTCSAPSMPAESPAAVTMRPLSTQRWSSTTLTFGNSDRILARGDGIDPDIAAPEYFARPRVVDDLHAVEDQDPDTRAVRARNDGRLIDECHPALRAHAGLVEHGCVARQAARATDVMLGRFVRARTARSRSRDERQNQSQGCDAKVISHT